MDKINDYLLILTGLIAYFLIIIFYLKFNYQRFTEINQINEINEINQINKPLNTSSMSPIGVLNRYSRNENYLYQGQDNDVQKHDSRYIFSDLPPVNPIIVGTELENVIPVEHDLYSTQGYIAPYTQLDNSSPGLTNQLDYSGGLGKMIKIPLQYNVPNNEQLRSQVVLVTDYNKIKYT